MIRNRNGQLGDLSRRPLTHSHTHTHTHTQRESSPELDDAGQGLRVRRFGPTLVCEREHRRVKDARGVG